MKVILSRSVKVILNIINLEKIWAYSTWFPVTGDKCFFVSIRYNHKCTPKTITVQKKDIPKIKEKVKGVENKDTGKFVNNADDVVFKQSSIDKAFSKHRNDFGNYPDGSKTSVQLFKNDVSELINIGVQKQGKYRNFEGTHIYNEETKQWTFINSDGTMNTAFKLSESQYKYLVEKGVVK